MRLNKLIGFSVVAGMLITGCVCLALPAYASEPGTDERPTVIRREKPKTLGFIPMKETQMEEAPVDPVLYGQFLDYQVKIKELELRKQQEAHRQEMDRERLALERERRVQTQPLVQQQPVYQTYTAPAPVYRPSAPVYVPPPIQPIYMDVDYDRYDGGYDNYDYGYDRSYRFSYHRPYRSSYQSYRPQYRGSYGGYNRSRGHHHCY